MPITYMYDVDGYYMGKYDDPSPYLANRATYTAPELKAGFIPRWDGEKWSLIETHKGESGFVGDTPITIDYHGPLPDGFTKEPPAPAPVTDPEVLSGGTVYKSLDIVDGSVTLPTGGQYLVLLASGPELKPGGTTISGLTGDKLYYI